MRKVTMQKNSGFSDFINLTLREKIYCLTLAATIAIMGCLTSKPKVVDEKYLTMPLSYTDNISRTLAIGTFKKLPDLYKNYKVGAKDVLEISIFEW